MAELHRRVDEHCERVTVESVESACGGAQREGTGEVVHRQGQGALTHDGGLISGPQAMGGS